jgi:hypothetical protein
MASRNAFGEKFYQLLTEIPAESTLEEFQYLYRQALFGMGLTILDKFPAAFYGAGDGDGPLPRPPGGLPKTPPVWAMGGPGGAGPHPNVIVPGGLPSFVQFVLDGQTPHKKKPRKKRG